MLKDKLKYIKNLKSSSEQKSICTGTVPNRKWLGTLCLQELEGRLILQSMKAKKTSYLNGHRLLVLTVSISKPWGIHRIKVRFAYIGHHNIRVTSIKWLLCLINLTREKLKLFQLALRAAQGVQPAAHGPHAAQGGYECVPTQNRKFT